MAQKIINVGTVANDGTGDTIRGAFTNVNANFTEVYGNVSNLTTTLAGMDLGQNTTIQASYNTANLAFDKANSVNTMVYNVAVSANAYSVTVGTSSNLYAVSVGAASNSYTQGVGTAGNNYASILSANNAVAANAWANTVAVNTYTWANSKFDTIANTTVTYNMANSAFNKANAAVANAAGTIQGNIFFTGTVTSAVNFTDSLGPLRERLTVTVNSNAVTQFTQSVVFANNSNTIHVKIPDDNAFQLPANVGTTIQVYQFGTGNTKIVANDAAVTIVSSNNWANIAGQYLTATAVKVQSNTWMLFGNLKA